MDWYLESVNTQAAFANGLADISFKAALLLLVALIATFTLRRSSASVRHQIWTVAVCAVLALPVLSAGLPALEVPLLESPVQAPATTRAAPQLARSPLATPSDPEHGATAPASTSSADERVDFAPAALPNGPEGSAPAPTAMPNTTATPRAFPAPTGKSEASARSTPAIGSAGTFLVGGADRWVPWVVVVYLAGALLLLVRLAFAALAAWWTVRNAVPVRDPALLAEADSVRRQLDLRSEVSIVESDRVTMPMAWGALGSTILLPRSARRWTHARRRVVLLHEMAHLKRRDCQTLLLARVVNALHWFNPLAWVATNRLQAERERACDDLVLSAGTRGPDYAQHLLDIARAMRPSTASWATVAMARPSELEGRLLAILDPQLDRRRATRFASTVGVVAMGLLLMPLAALQPWAEAAQQASDSERIVEQIRLRIQNEIDAQIRIQIDPAIEIETAIEIDPAIEFDPAIEMAINTAVNQLRDYELAWEGAPEETQQNPRVMEAFNTALQDEDAGIRATAAQALGEMENAAAVPALSQVLENDESVVVRAQAAWALGMIESDTGVPALSAALADAEGRVRSQAAWALGMIESDTAVAALVNALSDEEVRVRAQAAWALGMIESAEGVAGLSAALAGDESPRVRRQAAWALGMIEDEAALDALLDAFTDEDLSVRKQALWAVGQISG